ncbi:helix-turn-helix transcriptional regulator [Candidatus Margulisiibacteriota bacterium]
MKIKIKQLRQEAGLTQENLAIKANVPYTTLTKIESGVIKNPSIKVMGNIARVLGIHIEDLTEVKGMINTLKGPDSLSKLFDDVYNTLKDTGGEVFISGIDEKKFLDTDNKAITSHIKRLTESGITERLLTREGDSCFFSGSQFQYRWVPENLFNPTPIYVYGDKITMIVWGPPQEIIIIKNPSLADAYRKQFIFIWERAKIPPTKKADETEKLRLEKSIAQYFGGRISDISDKDRKIFRDFLDKEKSETYGNSYYYLCQAANGTGANKLGVKFYDAETLATIGIFNRSSLGGGWHFHIINPLGVFDTEKILNLAQRMLEISGNPVFVKKITKKQREKLLDVGFSPIEKHPWHAQAIEEDDTFPEQILDIKETIRYTEGPGRRDIKDKYQRFKTKHSNNITAKDLTNENNQDAVKLIKKFFEYLEMKELHISSPKDYDNIIFHPPLTKKQLPYFSQILYLNTRPVAFFATGPTFQDTASLFANITLHQELPYLSEYLIVYVCKILEKAGYKYLNLGGSETSGLFQFKEKFLPVKYNKMHWVVYQFN